MEEISKEYLKIQENLIKSQLQILDLNKEEDYEKFKCYYKYCKFSFSGDKYYSYISFYDKLIEYFPQYRSFLRQGVETFPYGFKPKEICVLDTLKDIEAYLIELHKELDKHYNKN